MSFFQPGQQAYYVGGPGVPVTAGAGAAAPIVMTGQVRQTVLNASINLNANKGSEEDFMKVKVMKKSKFRNIQWNASPSEN